MLGSALIAIAAESAMVLLFLGGIVLAVMVQVWNTPEKSLQLSSIDADIDRVKRQIAENEEIVRGG